MASAKDMIFLSHANPEDNEVTRWLALQLAREGYPVWCDLTKLLGGEVFWDDVEKALRERTVQFLYVLSKGSNEKDGALRELHLAQSVARQQNFPDFVIPLKIDDLSHGQVTIELQRVNSISFHPQWSRGLGLLFDKLEEQGIAKSAKFGPTAVSSWWRTQFSPEHRLISKTDRHLSNWYPVLEMPSVVHYHRLSRTSIGKVDVIGDLPFPGFKAGADLIAFAPSRDLEGSLAPGCFVESTESIETDEILRTKKSSESWKHVSRLLRLAWESCLAERLPAHTMSNQNKCFYFKRGSLPADMVHFKGVGEKRAHRNVVGYKTLRRPDGTTTRRFWHFGIVGSPLLKPIPQYCISARVLFSFDGVNIWDSNQRLARARRSQCKDWWNHHWRDRLLGTMSWLAQEKDVVELPVSRTERISIQAHPVYFESEVSYLEPGEVSTWDWGEDEEEKEEEEEFGDD